MISGVTRDMLPHLSGVTHLHVNRPLIGTSGSDNGDSKGNIAAEMYPLHPLKLFRDSCKSTSCSRREIRLELRIGNHVRVQTKKVKFIALLFLPQVKIKSAISRLSRAGTAKNLTKKRDARAELFFYLLNLLPLPLWLGRTVLFQAKYRLFKSRIELSSW